MKRILSVLALTVWGPFGGLHANKALDYLEAELGDEDWAAHGSSEGVPAAEKKSAVAVPDPELEARWHPGLLPYLSVRLTDPAASEVAFRGLWEWRMDHGDLDLPTGADREIDSSGSRRARLGFALKTYYQTELQADVLFDGDADYAGIERLLARVPVGDSFQLTGGKFPPPFTLEYTQDAAVRWRSELSPLVAQMVPASSLGLLAQGKGEQWDWKLGWFSGDADRDLPGWSGQGYLLVGVGYSGFLQPPDNGTHNISAWQRWHLDYIHNFDGAESRAVPMGYEHLLATGVQLSSGRFDFMSDFLLAHGDASSAWGVTTSAGYWILEDALRLVGRVDLAQSDDSGGVLSGWGVPDSGSAALQPFDYPVTYAGEELLSIYSGLDVYLYDRNFIISSGFEYRRLREVLGGGDIEAVIWQTGGRVAF